MKFLFFMMFNALILQFGVNCVNVKEDHSINSIMENINIEELNKKNKIDENFTINLYNNKSITQNEINPHNIKNDFLKENKNEKNLYKNKIEAVLTNSTFKIESIETQILVRKHKTEGEVLEKVKFVLKDGIFDSVKRKVSLGGTSDRQINFKLASRDVILTGAKIISNFIEPSSMYEHPYVCVIANFEPIDATVTAIEIEIEFEYISENLIRRREKPFSSQDQENVIVWIYDNNKKETSIDTISLSIKFEDEIDLNKLIAYPERFLLKHQMENSPTTISWTVKDIKPDSFKNFALNIPIFNPSCKGMNEVHLEITTYSVIQFFIYITILIVILSVLSFIYINKKEKHLDEEDDSCHYENHADQIK